MAVSVFQMLLNAELLNQSQKGPPLPQHKPTQPAQEIIAQALLPLPLVCADREW
jgi:hypothetical protein